MTRPKSMTKKERRRLLTGLLALLILCTAGALFFTGHDIQPLVELFPALGEIFPQESVPACAPAQGHLQVHILDVGQADCILVRGPEKTLVIDGGESKNAPDIVGYLRDQGVEEIDYYLNTHPHADHYGGIRQVMEEIPTAVFCHHPVPEKIAPTTRGYEKLMDFLAEETANGRTKVQALSPGDTLDLGGGAVLTILGPLEEYGDLNNNSLVGRLTFGKTAFLFTGDAEGKSEKDILKGGATLSAQVYSIPHHGSSTGVTDAFLEAVSPQYATISVGEGNDYGHPHRETLKKLSDAGIPLYRTDLAGNIVFDTDGETLTVSTDR